MARERPSEVSVQVPNNLLGMTLFGRWEGHQRVTSPAQVDMATWQWEKGGIGDLMIGASKWLHGRWHAKSLSEREVTLDSLIGSDQGRCRGWLTVGQRHAISLGQTTPLHHIHH